jgi:hypothetical protein
MHKTGQYLRPGTGRIRPLAISKQVTEIHNATKLETMLGGVGTQTGNCNPPARLDTVYIIGLVVQCGSGSLRQDGPHGTTAVVAGCPSVPSPPRHAKPKDDPQSLPRWGRVVWPRYRTHSRCFIFSKNPNPSPAIPPPGPVVTVTNLTATSTPGTRPLSPDRQAPEGCLIHAPYRVHAPRAAVSSARGPSIWWFGRLLA